MTASESPSTETPGRAIAARAQERGVFFLILGAAVLVRLPYLLFWDLFFSSDTAVLGLMARHFLRGDFSVYYWGEAYYGSLDSALLAPLFKIFGPTPGVSQWIPFVFSLLTIWVFYRYANCVLDRWSARVSTLILALAPPGLFQITHSVFNYTFILFFGIIHLSLFERFLRGEKRKWFFLISGLVLGFSWYYFRLILVFWVAIFLHRAVVRMGPDRWTEAKKKIVAFRFPRRWNDLILLRRAPIPVFLRRCLIVINIYNLANFLVACFLWMRGNWFFSIGRLTIKLYLWPIFKSSLMMALFVYAAVHYRKILPLLHSFWTDIHARIFAAGCLAGYSPALYGYLVGISPSSPGGLVALPKIAKNVLLAVPEIIPRLAGANRFLPLQGLAIVMVICGFILLGRLFWVQTRQRFRSGTEVKPYYAVLALCLTTAGLGLVGTSYTDPNTARFFVPFFLCLPVGIALGLEEIKKKSRLLAWGILLGFLGNSLWSNVLVWRNHAFPSRYESIAQNLAKEKIKGGYADYWSAYYLTFLAREEIILTPVSGKERYPPYLKFVQSLNDIVLLGESVPPGRDRVEIKGIEYEVLRGDVWEGLPVTFLRKSGPLCP
jgi:hypothetical protein